jgi:hypothetical protein
LAFRWSADGTALVLRDGGWEILLSGDMIEGKGQTTLSLLSAPSIVNGITVRAVRVIDDNPTRGQVRRLAEGLGFAPL